MSRTNEENLGTLETMFSKLSMKKPLTKSSAAFKASSAAFRASSAADLPRKPSAAFRASSAAIKQVITKPSEPHFNTKYPNITDPYDYDKMAFGDPKNWRAITNATGQLTGYEYTSPYNPNFTKKVAPGHYGHIMRIYKNHHKGGGGSRSRRTVRRKHKSHRKSKRVRHTRRKQTRRHRHRR